MNAQSPDSKAAIGQGVTEVSGPPLLPLPKPPRAQVDVASGPRPEASVQVFTPTAIKQLAGGTLTVTNLAGSLAAGVTFQLLLLVFNWTNAAVSFRLQSQTNALDSGLGAHWHDYPGGTPPPIIVPMEAASGSMFFRLSAP